MAIIPQNQLTNSTASTPAYPYGSAKDETSPGLKDGSEYKKVRADDVFGFQQALLTAAGITPNEAADQVGASQYLQCVAALGSGLSEFMTDTGAADAYVLDLPSTTENAPALFPGQRISFFTTNPNTGASTANVLGLGAVNIKELDGTTDPTAGRISSTNLIRVENYQPSFIRWGIHHTADIVTSRAWLCGWRYN
jgi:hypothetical protein